MPRKKDKIVAVYFTEPDTQHHEYHPFKNFCCREKDLDGKEKLLVSPKINTQTFIGNDIAYIDEIEIDSKLKSTDQYIYNYFDYNNNKSLYLTFNDVLKEITKRIKNKYAQVAYDGIFEKIEFSEDEFAKILSRMSAETHEISIAQIKSNGDYDEIIIIRPIKILL